MKNLIGVICLAILIQSIPTAASTITFVFEGDGAGSLNGGVFDSSYTITAKGDTDHRTSYGSGYYINHLSTSVDIAGVGVFDFITETRTFVNTTTGASGFSIAGLGGRDLITAPRTPADQAAFKAWDMLSPIGPISGLGKLLQWSESSINTSGGLLIFADQVDANVQFTATISEVPTPTAALLFASALIGLAGVARRRHS